VPGVIFVAEIAEIGSRIEIKAIGRTSSTNFFNPVSFIITQPQ
jgi:hypothetical protein